MAMEKQFIISETHTRAITAIGFHLVRREIVVGFEDGVIKWWEQDSGKLQLTTCEHCGWITDFQYWPDQKTLLSCGNDGLVIAWGSGGNVVDRIRMGKPIYVMSFNFRREQILFGFNGTIELFSLDPLKVYGNIIDRRKPYIAKHHTDIVPCLICHESKVFSAGYDGKFCIYDTTVYPGKKGLYLVHCNKRAHEAGINCMILVKDNENNTWLITGSFDRSVKIWSQDGQLRNKLETIFLHTITSLCYIPRAKVVWIASASRNATLFDPKAGENVTEFLPTFQSNTEEDHCHKLLKLRHNHESGQVVGSTNRRHVVVWKFNSQGCMTALKCKHSIESISYTRKVPMLLFSGGTVGNVYKWERLQSSYFMYSMETLTRKECRDKLEAVEKELGLKKPATTSTSSVVRRGSDKPSQYAYNKSLVAPSSLYRRTSAAILRCVYVEHLDLLVLASEDSHIYMWGFDYAAVSALTRLTPDKKEQDLNRKYTLLMGASRMAGRSQTPDHAPGDDGDSNITDRLNNNHISTKKERRSSVISATGQDNRTPRDTPETPDLDAETNDSVTNRVAGFICRDVLIGHTSCVTSLAVVHNEYHYTETYLISGGWDRRLLIWCLDTGKLHDCFRSTATHTYEKGPDGEDIEELACDGIILDIEYCQKRNEFAYTSSDGMVYIRQFSPVGSEMKLLNTLQGHDLEITAIRWNHVYDKWVTGSEDGSIKIWSDDGMTCEKTLSTQGAVSTLCVDRVNGSVVVAVEKAIKVYDLENCNLVQTNLGHTENIRSIVHVVERSQYVSGAWDKTIRIWNAYKRPVRRRRKTEEAK